MEFFPGEAQRAISEAVRRAREEGISYDMELPFVTAKGRKLWVQTAGTAEFENGTCVRLHGTFQDIAKRKLAELEQKKLQDQLNQAQKMETIGRLAGGIAHDFNNKLGVILGHVEFAMMGLEKTHPANQDLKNIENAARHSADLTRQLLGFARKQAASPKVIAVNTAIPQIVKMLQRVPDERTELAWLPGQEIRPVLLAAQQLDQILTNLVINARDAVENDGRISIATENIVVGSDDCAKRTFPNRPGDYVLISVTDNGHGMEQEELAAIFDPFFTTKPINQGTGLGLATVYGILEQNGGFITVDSVPGEGSTFYVYLSRHADSQQLRPEAPAHTEEPHGNETILVVEDSRPVRDVAERILKSLGYTVLSAALPREAVRTVRQYEGDIHLLLTDVIMPGMDGIDLYNRVRRDYPSLRCLYVSGYSHRVLSRSEGSDGSELDIAFLQKPFKRESLARAVRSVLDAHR